MYVNDSSFQKYKSEYLRVFPRKGAPNDSGVLENGDAQNFPLKFPTLKPTLFSNTQSLVGFSCGYKVFACPVRMTRKNMTENQGATG